MSSNCRFFITLFLFFAASLPSKSQSLLEGNGEPLGVFNTPSDENFVSVRRDASAVAFTRLKSPSNDGGVTNPGALFVSMIGANPDSAKAWAIGGQSTLDVGLGWSGSRFLFASVTEKYGAFSSEIFITDEEGARVQQVLIPYFRNKSPYISGSISADGKYLLLSLEGTTTYGVEDLYVSTRKRTGEWSAPKNLGPIVNTSFQEFSPFLSGDGQTLYWSTNGREGVGSFDVFYSQRLDETWQRWSEPQNLGTTVNTVGAETSFQLAGEYAYYVSTQDSDGYGDLRRAKLSIPEPLTNDSLQLAPVADEGIRRNFLFLDEGSGQEIMVKASFKGILLDTLFEDVSNVPLTFAEFEDLALEVTAADYVSIGQVITAAELSEKSSFRIMLQPLTVGTTVNLEHVLFARGTTDFITGSDIELVRVVEMLKENPTLKILVKGHTDNRGNADKNLELSQQRADKVKAFIVAQGVGPLRVESEGFGGTQPIASNDSEYTRKLNRRVEFTVIEQ